MSYYFHFLLVVAFVPLITRLVSDTMDWKDLSSSILAWSTDVLFILFGCVSEDYGFVIYVFLLSSLTYGSDFNLSTFRTNLSILFAKERAKLSLTECWWCLPHCFPLLTCSTLSLPLEIKTSRPDMWGSTTLPPNGQPLE